MRVKDRKIWLYLLFCLILIMGIESVGCKKNKDIEKARIKIMFEDDLTVPLSSELITRTKKVLDSKIEHWKVIEYHDFDWLKKGKVICFFDANGDKVVYFYKKDGGYFRLNCKEGIPYVNEILEEYSFAKDDFENKDRVESFLRVLVDMYSGSNLLVATKQFLVQNEKLGIDSWMRGTEKDEGVFGKLCFDPCFQFDGNKWEVNFNVFNTKGGVDKWKVFGVYDPERNTNEISQIEISILKNKGTFFYPLWG